MSLVLQSCYDEECHEVSLVAWSAQSSLVRDVLSDTDGAEMSPTRVDCRTCDVRWLDEFCRCPEGAIDLLRRIETPGDLGFLFSAAEYFRMDAFAYLVAQELARRLQCVPSLDAMAQILFAESDVAPTQR